LRVFGISDTFEEAVGGLQNGENDFGSIDEGSEAFAMTFAGLAEEDGADGASGAKSFLDKAKAFNADGAGFGGKTAAESHAKFLEPAIVAAGEERGGVGSTRGAGRFYRRSHQGKRSKFERERGEWGNERGKTKRKDLTPRAESRHTGRREEKGKTLPGKPNASRCSIARGTGVW
jgi:hypothetical protein